MNLGWSEEPDNLEERLESALDQINRLELTIAELEAELSECERERGGRK